MPLAVRFAEILADTGVSHGLIGPREVPRLWERHVLNCAVVADAFRRAPGLWTWGRGQVYPGSPWRSLDLPPRAPREPMLQRTDWLSGGVAELGLEP